MSSFQLSDISRIHFIGIGGIGMSALARFLLAEKKNISGSDRTITPITSALESEGVTYYSGQLATNITEDIELIIYTEAMAHDQEEMVAAHALGVPMVNYFEALGAAMNPYYLIAIAGTHGKTTTTAMLTDIFEYAEKDPTTIVGSLRGKTQSNFRFGKSKYAIVEACEYRRDFLHLRPEVLVITNIEHEHVDYYGSLEDVQKAFREMIERVQESGVVIAPTRDPNAAPILIDSPVEVIDYMEYFDLNMKMTQPGIHNRLNAAAAIAAAKTQKISVEQAKAALSQFSGTWRRFEYKGELSGAPVYDDYAHHPTEIKATIAGARELFPDKHITVVFQPHTYSRTRSLFTEFAKALGAADRIILLPIYGAREENISGVTSRELAVKALEYSKQVEYVDSLDEAEVNIRSSVQPNDVLIVMGAGTVSALATTLTK